MGNEGQRLVTKAWNQTARDYPSEVTIDNWIVGTMKRTPDAPAVTLEGITYSYADLDAASARIAIELEALGIGEECRVGVSMVRSFELCAVLLGILRAGAAYVPLDPTLPAERIRYMIDDSGAEVLFTHRNSGGLWTEGDSLSQRGSLTLRAAEVVLESSANFSNAQVVGSHNPRRLACVLYTSGSTGVPKGVMIEHASIANLFFWMAETFGFTERDVFIQNTPFGFDVSLTELFLPLTVGGQVVLARPEGHKDPTYLAGLVERSGVTVVNFVPSMFRAFIEGLEGRPVRSLRAVLSMGEPLSRDLAEAAALALPGVPLHNLYGLTETTVHATLWTFRQNHQPPNQVLVGRPLANTALYILDEVRRPVEIGQVGEIYIAGSQLARGYLNREELTKERFLANPFEPNSVMYKTGDLGRFAEDGNVEFLGRNDFQIKLRGLRIELGEIEHVLANVDGIRQSAVVLRHADNGEPLLVAYVRVGKELATRPTVAQLHEAASRALPVYMVPSAFVVMDAFPTNQNGKLDRGRLPPPERSAFCDTQFEPPVGELELLVASEWRSLLGPIGGTIGRNDSFALLGGHSLLAVQFVSRMRQRGWQLELADVFEGRTLAHIARCAFRVGATIDAANQGPPDFALAPLSSQELEGVLSRFGGRTNVQDILPLTPFQEGLLFHHKAAKVGDPYLLVGVLTFNSEEVLNDYLRGQQAILDRHDALRTCVVHTGVSEAVQVVLRKASVNVEQVTLRGSSEVEILANLLKQFGPTENSIDLESAPVTRLYVGEAQGTWFLVEVRHHILIDDASIVLCRQEVAQCMHGKFNRLPAPARLRDHVGVTSRTIFDEHALRFYRGMLGDLDTPTVPFGVELAHGSPPPTSSLSVQLPVIVAEKINRVAIGQGLSAATIFHLAWALVLNRITGQEKVAFGTVLVDRRGVEAAEAAVGPFMNTVPIALSISGTVAQSAQATQLVLGSLLRHVGVRLVEAQSQAAVEKGRPLFSSLLNYRFATLAEQEQELPEGISCLADESLATYPIAITVEPVRNGFRLLLRVHTSVQPDSIGQLLVQAVDQLVSALEQEPSTPVEHLDVLPPAQKDALINALNPSFAGVAYERIETIFERVVAQVPDRIALASQGASMTFAELNLRASQMSDRLRRTGVKPRATVALVFERGLELVCLQLAVLKAGGIYVPLDPSHPVERLTRQISLAAAKFAVVGSSELAESIRSRCDGICVVASRDGAEWQESSSDADGAEIGGTADEPAYVMFTSGSTGEPKGVVVTHAGVVRLVKGRTWLATDPSDQVTILSNPAFDGSTFEVWCALLNGLTGHVLEQQDLLDSERLKRRLLNSGVTIMFMPTALFHHHGDRLAEVFRGLRYLIVGGERLQKGVVEQVAKAGGLPRHLLNGYGPTETTVFSTVHEVHIDVVREQIPIGRPIDATAVYVVDDRGRLIPRGAVGELWVSGPGVALGYINAPDLTEEKFLQDPFCSSRGRLYKTGDLGRWSMDGVVEYFGRADSQLKIRGNRVEIGEVEACFRRCAETADVAVLATTGEEGEQQLVAFLCLRAGLDPIESLRSIRRRIERLLPSYMIPARIVDAPHIPLTANGKVNSEELLTSLRGFSSAGAQVVGAVDTVGRLAQLWARALGLNHVREEDDFFELGGHSLLAMTLVERMRDEMGLTVDVPMLFEHPTPAELLKAASFGEQVPE